MKIKSLHWVHVVFLPIILFSGVAVHVATAEFPKPGDWKPVLPGPTPNYVNCVAYGDGLWVAVGDFGYLATSPNGIDWTQRESSGPKDWDVGLPTGVEIASVAYGDGRWVACGSQGRVYTSTDGINWTNKIVHTDENSFLEEVVYANGRWVIAGDFGGVFTSANGVDWEKIPIDGAGAIWCLGYGNSTWVAIDWRGTIFTSENGTVWTLTGTFPDGEFGFDDVHFADGLWVCSNYVGQIFTSPGLDQWTMRYEGEVDWGLTSIAYASGRWVVSGGVNGPGNTAAFEGGVLLTSADGITWKEAVPEKLTFVWEVAYGDGLWLGASAGHGGLYRSYDGIDWRYDTSLLVESLPRMQVEAEHHDGMWIVPLSEGTILQSTDGQSWTARVLDHRDGAANYQPDWLNPAHYSTRLEKWFVGGDFGKLFSSPDGYNWKRENYPGAGIEGMAEGQGKLIAVGRRWQIYSSVNGSNWTKIDHPQSGASGDGRFDAITFANNTFVVVGDGGVIMSSADAESWTKATVSGRENLRNVFFSDGLWVAVGKKRAIYWSTNLTSWTRATISGSAEFPNEVNLNGAKKLDSTWIAFGSTRWSDPTMYTSEDGKNWAPYPAIRFPAYAIRDIDKVGDEYYLFGSSLRNETNILSTKGTSTPIINRDLLFTDSAGYTVKDTNEPEQFTSLPLEDTYGRRDETLYVSFKLQRESAFGPLDFTGLQLSRSATNLPRHEDLGFGNSGPYTYYGAFVEGPLPSISPDVQVPVDMNEHTIIARIDYKEGTVAMVTDPQSADEIESATRHAAPTHPFNAIMLRAGHADTAYTYSRIALGEDRTKVFEFTSNQPATAPGGTHPNLTISKNPGGDSITLSWPKTAARYILQSSRDLNRFSEIPSIHENTDSFSYEISNTGADTFYRLLLRP